MKRRLSWVANSSSTSFSFPNKEQAESWATLNNQPNSIYKVGDIVDTVLDIMKKQAEAVDSSEFGYDKLSELYEGKIPVYMHDRYPSEIYQLIIDSKSKTFTMESYISDSVDRDWWYTYGRGPAKSFEEDL